MTHTPGPWELERRGSLLGVISIDRKPICRVDWQTSEAVDLVARDNARLIAAAPDLLAALKRNLPAIRMTANLDDAEAAEAAIAKAEER